MSEYKIFYFKTDWCKICQKINPLFQWISQKYKKNNRTFYIGKLDNRKDLIEKFKIKEYPTFMIFKDNKEIYRQENGNLQTLIKNIISLTDN